MLRSGVFASVLVAGVLAASVASAQGYELEPVVTVAPPLVLSGSMYPYAPARMEAPPGYAYGAPRADAPPPAQTLEARARASRLLGGGAALVSLGGAGALVAGPMLLLAGAMAPIYTPSVYCIRAPCPVAGPSGPNGYVVAGAVTEALSLALIAVGAPMLHLGRVARREAMQSTEQPWAPAVQFSMLPVLGPTSGQLVLGGTFF